MAGKFVVYQDDEGRFRFQLKSRNGQVIASGDSYSTKKACLSGIASIRRVAPDALLIDRTESAS